MQPLPSNDINLKDKSLENLIQWCFNFIKYLKKLGKL